MGQCLVECELVSQRKHVLPFIITTPDDSSPVIGDPTIRELGLLIKVNTVSDGHWALQDNPALFEGIGEIKIPPYELRLKPGAQGVVNFSNRVPFRLKKPLRKQLASMLKEGIIKKVREPTEWVNPLTLVKKPDDSIRVCLDPAHLNKSILREHYVMPSFDEITSTFHGAQVFSTLDAQKGFYMIKLSEDS